MTITNSAPDFTAYSVGVVYASVCTALTDEAATNTLNQEHPTGIASRWSIADEPFADGTANGSACGDQPATHRHLLFTC